MEKNKHSKITIGGQALIEGIMMRHKANISLAVRTKKGSIYTESFKIKFLEKFCFYKKLPILRGIVEMISSLAIGYKCLLKSAEKSSTDQIESSSNNSENMGIFEVFSFIFGISLTVIFFMFLPSFFVKTFGKVLYINNFFKVLLEGLIKISIFIGYIFLMSAIPDIKRTFEYHGAEHKTIACFEKGDKLTVENVIKHSRFHPRCGTNFIFIVLIISIFIFSFLTWQNLILRLILKFCLLPLITGISYEIIKFASKTENILTKILIMPGLLLQRLTTKEPNAKQIEVAIKAVEKLFEYESKYDNI